jgi:hypothetical protein
MFEKCLKLQLPSIETTPGSCFFMSTSLAVLITLTALSLCLSLQGFPAPWPAILQGQGRQENGKMAGRKQGRINCLVVCIFVHWDELSTKLKRGEWKKHWLSLHLGSSLTTVTFTCRVTVGYACTPLSFSFLTCTVSKLDSEPSSSNWTMLIQLFKW